MSIRILKAGIYDTIQDQGRDGFSKWGINVNGAMDFYAADVANALVGNDSRQAVIEMHFPAGEILFDQETTISITGGEFAPAVNGSPISSWRTIIVPSGSVLSFKRREKGMRVYLAVSGGFRVNEWLGSRSTNVKSGAGGFEGRRLQLNDVIETSKERMVRERKAPYVFPWSVNIENAYTHPSVGLLPGNEFNWLVDRSKTALVESNFSVHSSSDRMATHLVHEPLPFETKEELFSSAVTFGTVQLLPSGKLIVLMADHQTTGGYPRIGYVASAYLPLLSQFAPGEKFRLHLMSSGEAEKMLFSLRTEMNKIRNIVREKLENVYVQR